MFAAFKVCGGDPTGSWTAVDHCQRPVQGQPDPKCPAAVQESGPVGAKGTATFDGKGLLTIAGGFELTDLYHSAQPASCIAPVDCATYEQILAQQLPGVCCASIGDVCDCLATKVNQVPDPVSAAYVVDGSTLTVGALAYELCVDGADLWLHHVGDATLPETVEHYVKT